MQNSDKKKEAPAQQPDVSSNSEQIPVSEDLTKKLEERRKEERRELTKKLEARRKAPKRKK